MHNKGKFIVFEGVDHSGKTLQTDLLSTNLFTLTREKKEIPNMAYTKEPGCRQFYFTETMRKFVVNRKENNIDDTTAIFLYLADRSYHVKNFIVPELNKGNNVVSDRYYYSNIAYQSNEIFIESFLELLNIKATEGLKPDLIIYMDTEPKEILKRRGSKSEVNDDMDINRIIEIQNNYKRILGKESNVLYIKDDGTKSPVEISLEIFSGIRKLLSI